MSVCSLTFAALQVVKEMKRQYLDMYRLSNYSTSFLRSFKEVEVEVGDLVWMEKWFHVLSNVLRPEKGEHRVTCVISAL